MSKTKRYEEFTNLPNTHSYVYQDVFLDMAAEITKPIVVEVGCGSGAYTIELAKRNPNKHYIGIDRKSDRLHFGAKFCLDHHIDNTSRLCASVDHISNCFHPHSLDEIRITFPDPRATRDRQKLTSPKYLAIYISLLKPWGIIHLKTDDRGFFDFSIQSMQKWWCEIIRNIEDIYSPEQERAETLPELSIKTYYETKRLAEGRKVYYLECKT